MSDVFETVRRIVVEKLRVDPLRVSTEASWDQLDADSLDRSALAMEFERAFLVELTDEDLESMETVGDAVSLIERKRA